MKMDCYPQYKSSNINWIGDIPDHWSLKKIKYICKNYDSKRIPLSGSERAEKSGDYPYYGATGVIDYVDDYIFDGEYILIGEDGAPFFENNRDVAFIASNKFWVNNHAHILKANLGLSQKIIVHQLNCVQYKEYISGSTRDKLTQDELKEIVLPFIPLSEQQSIAAFLDYKTEQIDKLIEKKEQLLKLLEEKRIALITRAVTKGLDPNVKMKPSGIDWLGDIPEHWEVKKIRYACTKVLTGTTPPSIGDDYFENGTVDWFTPGDFSNNFILRDSNKKLRVEAFTDGIVKLFPKNSVLLIGIGATLGKVGYCETNSSSNQQINTLIPSEKLNYKFLTYVLASFIDVLKVLSNATTLGILNQEKTKQFVLPVPPKSEQEEIVCLLDTELEKLTLLSGSIKDAIDKLKEYRTALITSAVTGKIDVRDFKPPWEE